MDLIILTLTTWRISSLLVNEGGPFDIFGWLRFRLGVRYNEAGRPYGSNMLAEGLSCLWCTSFWVGLLLTGLYLAIPGYITWLGLPFALSAGAILFEESKTWLQYNR